jgi:DNA-directed RNA polymerase specialized sigma24 family protein
VVRPTPCSGQEENLDPDIVELDHAWRSLSVMDRRHGQLVGPMFLCGLSIEDTAYVLKISSSMVKGDLTAARVSLQRELDRTGAP